MRNGAGHDFLGIRRQLPGQTETIDFLSLECLEVSLGGISNLPISLRILLENLVRHLDRGICEGDVRKLVKWGASYDGEAPDIAFHPSYVLMHDTTATPALVDIAAMRDVAAAAGVDPREIAPELPVFVSIDHSVAVDAYGSNGAVSANLIREFEKNGERYAFFKWAEQAFPNVRFFRPGTGICHQLNLERITEVVRRADHAGRPLVFPDTLVGLDSHTPMINALGVLGWGVGGLTGGAALLGLPVTIRAPEVIGVRLVNRLPEGVGATDLALTLTERFREIDVVGSFVEFFGEGISNLSLSDRATVSNMAPEYGCTVTFFPIDARTLDFLMLTGRSPESVALVEAYTKAQGFWHDPSIPAASYSHILEVDLGLVERSVAGPSIPHRRMPASRTAEIVQNVLPKAHSQVQSNSGEKAGLRHGDIVIAAITSCTNTANPRLLIEAGLLARNAHKLGLSSKPWVKTSFGPGSHAVANYLDKAGLTAHLDALGFNIVGFGCTTCIGNSGRLEDSIEREIEEHGIHACAVLSGNRNFDGRINPSVGSSYLMSPALVVAYAIAGSMKVDMRNEPMGGGVGGGPIFLADIWPDIDEVTAMERQALDRTAFAEADEWAPEGRDLWDDLSFPTGDRFAWNPDSEYLRPPRYVTELAMGKRHRGDVQGARILMLLGDNVTTDHISPAGAIRETDVAGRYLAAKREVSRDFSVFAARRGNFEVMARGVFSNPLLENEIVPGRQGGLTRHWPDGGTDTVFAVAEAYRAEDVPTVVIAGRNFGAGSSRDWAAKGLQVLGVRAVIAQSFERIHRCNLIDMGVLPLQFPDGTSQADLSLLGSEIVSLEGIEDGIKPGQQVQMSVQTPDGKVHVQNLICRADTQYEARLLESGGFIAFYLRGILNGESG